MAGAAALCVSTAEATEYAPIGIQRMVESIVSAKHERPNRRSHVIDKLRKHPVWNSNLAGSLIMSKFYYQMGIQDIEEKMDELMYDFPGMIRVDSIGKSFEGADIPVFTLADPSGKVPISERPAILITGATHARELSTVQMCFYTMFRLLHGHVHNDEEVKNMLKEFTFYAIPALNVDGVKEVSNAWTKFGYFPMHRKNNNDTYGNQHKCGEDLTKVGVDLNRNWGFGFHTPQWISDDLMKDSNGKMREALDLQNPCSDAFQGHYPFSEPETRAARDFILSKIGTLKFVANYHAYGNDILKPFNSTKKDLFKDIYPDANTFLNELIAEGSPPEGLKVTTAPEALGYNSPGEMSDWIMAATGIPAITPEIGTKDKCSETFYIKTLDCITDTLDAQYPLVKTTFKKIGSQIDI